MGGSSQGLESSGRAGGRAGRCSDARSRLRPPCLAASLNLPLPSSPLLPCPHTFISSLSLWSLPATPAFFRSSSAATGPFRLRMHDSRCGEPAAERHTSVLADTSPHPLKSGDAAARPFCLHNDKSGEGRWHAGCFMPAAALPAAKCNRVRRWSPGPRAALPLAGAAPTWPESPLGQACPL